jgi:hypothetical protein
VAADAPLRYSEHQLPIRKPEARCKAWPRHLHCRRRTHKAFLRWYSENEPKFAIKLELLRRTDTDLDIGFCRINRIVTASLVDDEIIIAVMWEGECWDMLRDFETYPKRVRDGYPAGSVGWPSPSCGSPAPTRGVSWGIGVMAPRSSPSGQFRI